MQITSLKKSLLLLLAVCGLAMSAQAQQPKRAPAPRTHSTPEQKVDRMAQQLSLTPTQKAQFMQLEREHRAKMEAQIAEKQAASTAHRQAQRALLTPEQAVKFDAMQQKHRGKGQGKGQGKGRSKTRSQ